MESISLPIVPFGKYKNQPVTLLMADTKYLEWCKTQPELLQKFPFIFNICVNQTITTNNHPSKTPEHNKLQNMFLYENRKQQFINYIYKNYIETKTKLVKLYNDDEFCRYFTKIDINNIKHSIYKDKIEFEAKFNWDILISHYERHYITFFTNENNELDEKTRFKIGYNKNQDDRYKKVIEDYEQNLKQHFNELSKQIIHDDFYKEKDDRNMIWELFNKRHYYNKTEFIEWYDRTYDERFELSYNEYRSIYYKNLLEKYGFNKVYLRQKGNIFQVEVGPMSKLLNDDYDDIIFAIELKPSLGDDYPEVLRKMKTQIQLTKAYKKDDKNSNILDNGFCVYYLVVHEFNSTNTSIEELVKIFAQSKIRVLFINDIFNETSQYKRLSINNDNSSIEIKSLIDENKLLKQRLLALENIIKE